ncbi:hypothetical protein LCGC14_0568720 [marine sediment metagenome]|uniref:Uncharacterized protein n=1 Tax=marine sediment metagenome TaxID=412755 RepID=A0A0F9U695_9ZZZZ|nr:hypothetical protein [Phycisphaerae bacterium]
MTNEPQPLPTMAEIRNRYEQVCEGLVLRDGPLNQSTVYKRDVGVLLDANAGLLAALNRCSELFGAIRLDWQDPRSDCREGQEVITAALAAAEPGDQT